MSLCFGTFGSLLHEHRNNISNGKAKIGRALLDMLDPNYCEGKYDSYIDAFVNQRRHVPAKLVREIRNPEVLQDDFEQLMWDCLNIDHERITQAFVGLIQSDEGIAQTVKDGLLEYADPANLPLFLANIYFYVIQNTVNLNHPIATEEIKNKDSFRFLFSLPYLKNIYFTDREKVFEEICDFFQKGKSPLPILTISGMSGIGKTQLALKYAYDYMNTENYDTVWWVNARSEESLVLSCKDFVTQRSIVKRRTDEKLIITKFLHWFANHKKWLLVYDNADDMRLLEDFIPKTTNGHILITTCLSVGIGEVKPIGIFDPPVSVEYLEKRTRLHDAPAAEALAVRLGHLPLALELAGAYIAATPDMNYAKYLDSLNRIGSPLLDKARAKNYDLTIRDALNLSLEKIRMESARQLLKLCSYFAPNDIEIGLFADKSDFLPEPLKRDITDIVSHDEILRELTRYSLCQIEDGKISMHPLVQEIIREGNSTDETLIRCCLSLIQNAVEYDNTLSEKSAIEKLTQYISHAADIVGYAEKLLSDNTSRLAIADISAAIGNCMGFLAAEERTGQMDWLHKSLGIRKEILGEKDVKIAETYHDLGWMSHLSHDFNAALDWFMWSAALYEELLGAEHKDTAFVYSRIGDLCSRRGEYGDAVTWYMKQLTPTKETAAQNNTLTYTEHAKLIEQADDPIERERLRAVLQNVQDVSSIYYDIGKTLVKAEKCKEALVWLEKSLAVQRILDIPKKWGWLEEWTNACIAECREKSGK